MKILHRLTLLPCLLAACAEPPAPSAVTRTDSAGIAVVESSGPAWGEGEAWTVGEVRVDLARGEGDVDYEFDRIRDLMRLATGEIVVAEPTRVRLYDERGDLQWSFGRDGQGPGEFGRLTDLEMRGDTIVAWDYWQRRVTLITQAGELARVVTIAEGILGSDLLLLGDRLALETRFASMEEGGPMGLVRVPSAILAADWEGRILETITDSPGSEGVRVAGPGGISDHRAIFGRSSHLAELRGDLVIGDAVFLGFRQFDADGNLKRMVRGVRDLTLTDSLYQDERDARLESSQDRTLTLEGLSLLPRPHLRPAYLELRVDRTGAVWLREHRGEIRNFLHQDPRHWEVFGADGEWLGAVTTPAGVEIYEIGDDWILGMRPDDLGVQHPIVLHLDRGGATSSER